MNALYPSHHLNEFDHYHLFLDLSPFLFHFGDSALHFQVWDLLLNHHWILLIGCIFVLDKLVKNHHNRRGRLRFICILYV